MYELGIWGGFLDSHRPGRERNSSKMLTGNRGRHRERKHVPTPNQLVAIPTNIRSSRIITEMERTRNKKEMKFPFCSLIQKPRAKTPHHNPARAFHAGGSSDARTFPPREFSFSLFGTPF
ncbi:hypothetical protein L3X38_030607 [Prunus dulcis]|uniref:Uncharacterized protein n=1 Tax=Prunus dulcis TaxID=3755 RepID=A0AAD4VBT1_PRUDU|nr:hypothetical protein L3X38_030607 [Prunus dulcis]